jgi:YfiH family protein
LQAKKEVMIQPELHFYDFGEGVTAFSTTRQGGFSKGSYGEFNINRYCGDNVESISQNRALLCGFLGIDDCRLLMPHQVHETEIVAVNETTREAELEGVDALMTNIPGICIGVSTADCIPVLLCDKTHRAVCAIHAGWRGTVKRIVEKAVGAMTSTYDTRPADIQAQIGPGIHVESFEVGDEVYEAFANDGFEMGTISRKVGQKWHIDLPECNRQQLLASGVPAAQVDVSPICTYQHPETYFSARRLSINSGRIFTGILMG